MSGSWWQLCGRQPTATTDRQYVLLLLLLLLRERQIAIYSYLSDAVG